MGKRKKNVMLITVIGMFLIIATACGGKSQESVVKKIEGNLQETNGYKVNAKMTMNTGKEPRSYNIDVWYKKGKTDFYRVGLENEAEEGGQVILKNEEGVFVLTPTLQKSFKFQSEWPEHSSQPYLYQSIVKDVLADKDATFTAEDDYYVFDTKTNYQNNTNLPFQKVYFDKKTYRPIAVKVLDKEKQVLVEVTFNEMELDPNFAKGDFEREAILENTIADSTVTNMEQEALAVLFPLDTHGAELTEKQEVDTENGKRVIMTFKGERNFTLIQEKDNVLPTTASLEEVSGEVVHLGHSIGAISDNTIEWNYEGTDFVLASEDMTREEMIDVASSIQGKELK